MDQKNHDFIDSAVLFSRSAVTVKQKSVLVTEGLKSMMEKITEGMTASRHFIHKYLLTRLGRLFIWLNSAVLKSS